MQKEAPEGMQRPHIPTKIELRATSKAQYAVLLMQYTQAEANMRPNKEIPYFDYLEEKWVIGEITYLPLRLAYAATVHKTQGLTLDTVQIDYSNAFFGQPSMSYVALSRIKSPQGLKIVGNPALVARRTNISTEVLKWL